MGLLLRGPARRRGGSPDGPGVAVPGATPGWRLRATAWAGVLLCAAAGATSPGCTPPTFQARARTGAGVRAGVAGGGSDLRSTAHPAQGQGQCDGAGLGRSGRRGDPGRAVGRLGPPDPGAGSADRAAGQGKAEWLRLLPSTRLRVGARLAPPLRPGEPFAAVLKVDGAGLHRGSSAGRACCNGRRGTCAPVCGRRPRGSIRTRGLCCRDWSSGTPPGSVPSCGTRSRRPTSLICWRCREAISRSCCRLIGRPGRAHQVERGACATDRAVAAGHGAGRRVVAFGDPLADPSVSAAGLWAGRPARDRDRAPEIADPRAGRRRPRPGARRPLARGLRLPALGPGDRGAADDRAAVERGAGGGAGCPAGWRRRWARPWRRRRCARRSWWCSPPW
ncbi:hypothetical protein STANM309S_04147 [Streptomyces tanashiensis]